MLSGWVEMVVLGVTLVTVQRKPPICWWDTIHVWYYKSCSILLAEGEDLVWMTFNTKRVWNTLS